MLVSFNPTVQNNRPQKTNFKALDIPQITKNEATARGFIMDVAKGKILKTDENVKDLLLAIQKSLKEKKLDVSTYLEEVRDEVWKVKQ